MKNSIFVFTLTALIALPAAAQRRELKPQLDTPLINDVQKAKVAMHPLTRYLEKSSVLAVDINVAKIDMPKALQWLQEHAKTAGEMPLDAQQTAMATGFIESLKGAGVDNLYITASTRSLFDGGPVVVIPCDNTQAVHGLAALVAGGLPKKSQFVAQIADDAVLLGPKVAVDRVKAADGEQRNDLILPLLNKGTSDHLMVAQVSPEIKKDLVAFWPDRVPNAPEIKISPRAMAEDLQSASIGWNLPPKPHVVAELGSTGGDATARVMGAIMQLLAMSPEAAKAIQVTSDDKKVIVEASPDKLAEWLQAVTGTARARANNMQDQNSLKQIGLAMHNYHDAFKHFPPRALTDPDGKPLLGWRVTVLPYIEQAALAKAIRMDKAWDAAENKAFNETAIMVFSGNMRGTDHPTKTRIRVPVIKGSFWQGDGPPRTIRDIRDGTSNTIAALLAPESAAVDWMSPEPWVLSEDDPISDVFGDQEVVNALFFDGSVRTFSKEDLDNKKLKALLTFAGGEAID